MHLSRMPAQLRIATATVILCLPLCILLAQVRTSPKPLSKDEIIRLLKGDVSPKRVEELARERGIDFPINPDTETNLRQAGANDALLATLRNLAKAVSAEPLPVFALDRTLVGHTESVSAVSFSPDSLRLASGSGDGTIKIWEVNTGQEIHTITGHKLGIEVVAFSADGRLLASGTYTGGEVKISDAASGGQVQAFSVVTPGRAAYLAFSPDGSWVASADVNDIATLKIWETASGHEIRAIGVRMSDRVPWVASLEFSPDGQWLAAGHVHGFVSLRQVDNPAVVRILDGHAGQVRAVAFSPDGSVLASVDENNSVKLWRIPSGEKLRTMGGEVLSVGRNPPASRSVSVAFSPDGRWLASTSWESIKLWDVATGGEISTLTRQTSNVLRVVFSPNGRWLASGSEDGTVKLWRRHNT